MIKNRIQKIFGIIAFILVLGGAAWLIGLAVHRNNSESARITVVASSFPGYDFLRALTQGDDSIAVKMLLKPGADMHSFEPTPEDIRNIQNSNMLVYVGGDSDKWFDEIISNLGSNKTMVVKMLDLVETVTEEYVDGMEGSEDGNLEPDEHVWTSPVNAVKIVQRLKDALVRIDPNSKELYEKNARRYVEELNQLDAEIRELVASSKRREIVVGDRFPLRYFVDEYGLSYYAAFPGCSEQTEASARTIAFLINKVREDNIPVVFRMELSDGKIAETIARETGAKVLEFKSAHNISQEDFDKALTYLDIMRGNIEVLREALN